MTDQNIDFEKLQDELSDTAMDALSFIRFYEKNMEAIEGLDDSDANQKQFKFRMRGDYGLSLAAAGITAKATDVLREFVPRFERESGLSAEERLKNPYYEGLLWSLGSCSYYTAHVGDTEKAFQQLVRMSPDNVKYRNWLMSTRERRFKLPRRIIYTSAIIWAFCSFVFLQFMEGTLKGMFLLIGPLLMVLILVMEGYIYFYKKRI